MTIQEIQYVLPFSRRSENSDWVFKWWSVRKYILKHTQMANTFDTKITLHNYIYIEESPAIWDFFPVYLRMTFHQEAGLKHVHSQHQEQGSTAGESD